MKREIKVSTTGLELTAFVLSSIFLFSYDHQGGGFICLCFIALFGWATSDEIKEEKKKSSRETIAGLANNIREEMKHRDIDISCMAKRKHTCVGCALDEIVNLSKKEKDEK